MSTTSRRIAAGAVTGLVLTCALAVAGSVPASAVRVRPGAGDGHSHAHAYSGLTATEIVETAFRSSDPTGRALSGARTTAHRANGRRAPAAVPQRGSDMRVFYTGELAAEPTIGVDRERNVFVDALDRDQGVVQWPVLRSSDGGKTWDDVTPMVGSSRRHPTGQDGMLYVDKDTGRVFMTDFLVPCTPVAFSDDGGETWGAGSACGLADHQNLFSGPPALSPTTAYPNVVYYCAIDSGFFQEASNGTACLKSLDGGVTFNRTGVPAYVNGINPDPGNYGIPGHCSGVTGHGFVDEEGTVYLPRGWCGQPWLAISHDEGATWTRVQVADNGMPAQSGGPADYNPSAADGFQEHEAGVVVDERGDIYYVWTGRDRLPYLAVSRDGGETWGKPLMIGPKGLKEASLPAIDIGADGRVAIAYIGSDEAPGGKAPDGAGPEYEGVRWNGYVTLIPNPTIADPVLYTTTVNDPSDPLTVGECWILRCQQQYDFIDVVVDQDGGVWTSMVDGCSAGCAPIGSGIVGYLPPARKTKVTGL